MGRQKAEPAEEKCLAGHEEEPKTGRPLLGSAHSVEAAQELGEIVAGGGDLVTLVQILQATQGGAPHPAGVEHVGKAAFDVLAPFAQQGAPILAARRAVRADEGLALGGLEFVQAPLVPMRVTDHGLQS